MASTIASSPATCGIRSAGALRAAQHSAAPVARLSALRVLSTSRRLSAPPTRAHSTVSARRTSLTLAAAATEDAASDMNTMQPLGDRLLVVPQEKEPVTSGGVILPTEVSSVDMGDAVLGQVVALGEDVDIDVKVGQMVMYNKQQITEVPVGTSSVVFVSQNSIAAVLS